MEDTNLKTELKRESVERAYGIECRGRDAFGKEVFQSPIKAQVKMRKGESSLTVQGWAVCPYTSSIGYETCRLQTDKTINCPYYFTLAANNSAFWDDILSKLVSPEVKGLVRKFLEEIIVTPKDLIKA